MEEVYNFIRNNIGLKMEDSVVIGVSGGPDSMCLLDIIRSLNKNIKNGDIVFIYHSLNYIFLYRW